VGLMDRERIRPIVCSTYPMESVATAFEQLRSDVFGKIVVEIPLSD